MNAILKTMTTRLIALSLLAGLCAIACQNPPSTHKSPAKPWAMSGFERLDDSNPVLTPGDGTFRCPIRQDVVKWEEKDVFNPAAVVRDGKLHLIYRAEDTVGKYAGTSRLGLAISDDGVHFARLGEPVFYPGNDSMKIYEWEGGVEDPRLVESEDGRYIMTYTSYDGKTARLCLASSTDLRHWQKHGLVLGYGKYRDTWSKSGAIVCRRDGNRLIATPIDGRYWMYWGDTDIFAATSPDLIHWQPVEDDSGRLVKVISPRPGRFDCQLVEPGPPPLLTRDGIVFIYNSRNLDTGGAPDLPPGTYTAGQVLLDKNDPVKVLDRLNDYFFKPERDYEITGQVGNVCFLEALVPFRGQWFLYYGTADSKIAVAVCKLAE
ncbi:MAG: glycoside hydrolase family 130 protein [Saprospiraceae bacterium]